jgi:hypothetical protein
MESIFKIRILRGNKMFKKKKLYKIVYEQLVTYTTIISAKDEHQALNKFHKMTQYGIVPSIISFEEYKIGQ